MTPGRRRVLAVGGVVLVVGVVLASLAVMAVVALPLALVLGLTTVALVAGLGSRVLRGPRPGRARQARAVPAVGRAADVPTSSHPAGLRWATHWESAPPPDAVPVSRSRLAVVLAEWGLVGEAVEPAMLVVTELLSNAVDHGRDPVELAIEYSGGRIRVEVRDGAPGPPHLQTHDLLRARGRGLQLVDALSLRWGWTEDPPGKVVWADVPTEWPA